MASETLALRMTDKASAPEQAKAAAAIAAAGRIVRAGRIDGVAGARIVVDPRTVAGGGVGARWKDGHARADRSLLDGHRHLLHRVLRRRLARLASARCGLLLDIRLNPGDETEAREEDLLVLEPERIRQGTQDLTAGNQVLRCVGVADSCDLLVRLGPSFFVLDLVETDLGERGRVLRHQLVEVFDVVRGERNERLLSGLRLE